MMLDVNLIGISSIKNWGYDKDQNYVHDSNKFLVSKVLNTMKQKTELFIKVTSVF